MIRLALFQPDIPQNAGSLLRLGACLGVPVDVIGPLGFLWDERRMRRAGMDYLDQADIRLHSSWQAFLDRDGGGDARLALLTTTGDQPLHRFAFRPGDVIMVGREGAGVPDAVAARADARVRIPMRTGLRSLNVAMAASLAVGEALGQLDLWPADGEGVDMT